MTIPSRGEDQLMALSGTTMKPRMHAIRWDMALQKVRTFVVFVIAEGNTEQEGSPASSTRKLELEKDRGMDGLTGKCVSSSVRADPNRICDISGRYVVHRYRAIECRHLPDPSTVY